MNMLPNNAFETDAAQRCALHGAAQRERYTSGRARATKRMAHRFAKAVIGTRRQEMPADVAARRSLLVRRSPWRPTSSGGGRFASSLPVAIRCMSSCVCGLLRRRFCDMDTLTHNYAFERSARQRRCRVPSSLALLGARSTLR